MQSKELAREHRSKVCADWCKVVPVVYSSEKKESMPWTKDENSGKWIMDPTKAGVQAESKVMRVYICIDNVDTAVLFALKCKSVHIFSKYVHVRFCKLQVPLI